MTRGGRVIQVIELRACYSPADTLFITPFAGQVWLCARLQEALIRETITLTKQDENSDMQQFIYKKHLWRTHIFLRA